jgi:hypothetical protein
VAHSNPPLFSSSLTNLEGGRGEGGGGGEEIPANTKTGRSALGRNARFEDRTYPHCDGRKVHGPLGFIPERREGARTRVDRD